MRSRRCARAPAVDVVIDLASGPAAPRTAGILRGLLRPGAVVLDLTRSLSIGPRDLPASVTFLSSAVAQLYARLAPPASNAIAAAVKPGVPAPREWSLLELASR